MNKKLCPALETRNTVAEIDDRFSPPKICIFDVKAGAAVWLDEADAACVHEWLGRALSATSESA